MQLIEMVFSALLKNCCPTINEINSFQNLYIKTQKPPQIRLPTTKRKKKQIRCEKARQ